MSCWQIIVQDPLRDFNGICRIQVPQNRRDRVQRSLHPTDCLPFSWDLISVCECWWREQHLRWDIQAPPSRALTREWLASLQMEFIFIAALLHTTTRGIFSFKIMGTLGFYTSLNQQLWLPLKGNQINGERSELSPGHKTQDWGLFGGLFISLCLTRTSYLLIVVRIVEFCFVFFY